MTIHITWQAIWGVGKYLLTFGGGFVAGVVVVGVGVQRGIGRAMGW